MAKTYTQVSKGSSGGSVKELQKLLNQNGYNLSEDGVFGNKTLSAVKDYQSKNGLAVDGIVGNKTWGALTSKSADPNGANTANTDTGFTYNDYAESETVSQANAALNAQLGAKPGALQSTWEGQVQATLDKILNREEFSYDLNSDALYQQYKDQYTQLGKLASSDVMGQAAALTGGYGSSHASTVGNQAYQAYLSRLNEVVPELYGMALDRYNQEGEDLYNQYALLSNEADKEYSHYQDEYNKWLAETQLAYDRYAAERSFDYGVYSDDKSYAYDEYRNAIADEQWQQQFDESVRQYNESLAEQQRQFNANYSLNQQQLDLSKQKYNDEKAEKAKSVLSKVFGGSGNDDNPTRLENLDEIQAWSDAIINAETQEEVGRILPNLEALDPDLADALYTQWLKDHGYLPGTVDTTVSG